MRVEFNTRVKDQLVRGHLFINRMKTRNSGIPTIILSPDQNDKAVIQGYVEKGIIAILRKSTYHLLIKGEGSYIKIVE